MNWRRSWKSRCVEAGPRAEPPEVLRHGVGLPRHRSVDVVGEHVGVGQRDRLGRAWLAARATAICARSIDSVSSSRASDPLAAVLRRDLLQRHVLEDDDRRRHLAAASSQSTSRVRRSAHSSARRSPVVAATRIARAYSGRLRSLGRLDQPAHLVRCRHDRCDVRDRRRLGPLRRVGVAPAPPARLGEHRRDARVDLVHAARRQATRLVGPVQIGEHLRGHLRHGDLAERRARCCARRPARSRRRCSASGPCGAARRSTPRRARRRWPPSRCGGPCRPRRAARPGPSWRRAGCRGTCGSPAGCGR